MASEMGNLAEKNNLPEVRYTLTIWDNCDTTYTVALCKEDIPLMLRANIAPSHLRGVLHFIANHPEISTKFEMCHMNEKAQALCDHFETHIS